MSDKNSNPPTPAQRSGDIPVRSAAHACLLCGREMQPGERQTAVLIELPRDRRVADEPDFQRLDYCAACWQEAPWSGSDGPIDEGLDAFPTDAYGAEPVAVWTGPVPERDKPRRTFVDDRVLTQFFLRLADDEDPQRRQFRFVLMLILMRHRKLRHVTTRRGDDGDVWCVRLMPAMAESVAADPEQVHEVADPKLGVEEIGDVSAQLTQILHEDVSGDLPAGDES